MPQASRTVGRALVGAIAALSALWGASQAAAATFTHRTVVTIDHTQIAGVASLANFPVLVSVTDAALKTTANGGFVTSSKGYDIVFQGEDAPTCGGVYPPACRLDHEIESYDGVGGTIVAWVRVPAVFGILSGANTPIYMYYGDATITCPQENKTGVWDSSYREVFHLNEPAEHTDSTLNGFAAASRGAVTEGVAGKVGGAVDLAGGASGATVATLNISDGTVPTTTSLTVEAWVKFRSYTMGNFIGIFSKGREARNFDGDGDPGSGYCTVSPCGDWFGLYNLPDSWASPTYNLFSLGWVSANPTCKLGNVSDARAQALAEVQTNQWYQVAATYDQTTHYRRLYVNGTQVAADTAGTACLEAAIPQYARLGTDSNNNYLDGQIDEVRVSFAARSAAWITAGYNNQNNPTMGGFYSSISHQTGSWTVTATACPSRNPCAGGPGTCYLRSIGSMADYTTGSGTCTATNGSSVITCPSATWVTSNRGRGDRITIDGTDYMVLAVDSETQLRISSPFTGTTGVGDKSYAMSRQFATPQAWETCISGGGGCTYFSVGNGDLVTGDRSEVGVVYKDASPYTFATSGNYLLTIDGSTTDVNHTITLTADGVNRHFGISGAGVVLDNGTNTASAVRMQDQFVTVEWMEIRNGGSTGAHGIDYVPSNNANHGVIRNDIIRNCSGQSIRLAGSANNHVADIDNNIIYRGAREGIRIESALGTGTGSRVRVFNNTFLGNNANTAHPYTEISSVETPNPYVTLRNNIIADDAQTPDVTWNGLALCTTATLCDWWNAASSNNITGDGAPATGQWKPFLGPNPHGGGVAGATEASLSFVDTTAGSENLHIKTGSAAWNRGADLTGPVNGDIDAQLRMAPWDIGADEFGALTAVRLMSFAAVPGDGSVALEWRTGSELDNLGFHLYRGLSADGPWTRLTSSLIPGLGSSPLGQAYSWLDSGLVNGTTYCYRLEDVDTSSKSTFHGPVCTAPSAPGGGGDGGGGADGAERGGSDPPGGSGPVGTSSCPSWVVAAAPDVLSPVCTRYGDPDSTSLQVLARNASGATVELRTGGFWALDDGLGRVRVFVPGLEFPSDAKAAALPLRRTLVEAVVGKGVRLVSAEAYELQRFRELRPSAVGRAELAVGRNGTVRPVRRALAAPRLSGGPLPREVARLAGTVFQGGRKSAVVEMTPVRYSGTGLVLAGRVRVRLAFAGVAPGESGAGSRGRSLPRTRTLFPELLAQLHTSGRGLHAVTFERLFPTGSRPPSTGLLRLQRQGEAVAFHVEPAGSFFGPGSTLYFYADRTASSTDYSSEVAYELVRSSGVRMGTVGAAPLGAAIVSSPVGFSSFETNRIYQPGLLEAKDLWLWEYLPSLARRRESFALSGVDTASGAPAKLTVHLQGGSESGQAIDHHVELSVNGASVGETSFAGKRPQTTEVQLPACLLREGANDLSVVNVGDTGVVSGVFLDRFEVTYPQRSTGQAGVFEGMWAQSGTVEVTGLVGPVVILREDASGNEGAVKWLSGFAAGAGSVRFQAEAGRRYLVVSPEGLLAPRVARMAAGSLGDRSNQADYLVIAPREFLEAASPLVERRRSQGLRSRAVSFEEIVSGFGHGQASAEAIRGFLSYAYHSWRPPAPRYVLLLGDATYDPQHFLAGSWSSPLPALLTKTAYLWTASDPALAAVNGEDALPDLAIGRLPATTKEQAEALVAKLLAWEDSGEGLSGRGVFVADAPDQGGDFEADVEDVRASFLSGRSTTTLKVGELGGGTRPAILAAFDEGASLMSYVGHGGTAVWSSANVLNTWDVPSLRAQSRQPVLLTMNCLNGYFVAPNLDALPEALLKAEGRGVVAAFSPSGLSLDGPAHEYHRALVAELASGRHERLGDAVLAAQRDYAETGLMPDLLEVYQLLSDPALRIER
jgi:hypothetical protein